MRSAIEAITIPDTMAATMSDETKDPNKPDFREKEKEDNHHRIKDFVMRGGGEPFGKPFEVDTPSLTERVVTFFKQRGFFGFETLEKPQERQKPNKFTKYGASRFRGRFKEPPKED